MIDLISIRAIFPDSWLISANDWEASTVVRNSKCKIQNSKSLLDKASIDLE